MSRNRKYANKADRDRVMIGRAASPLPRTPYQKTKILPGRNEPCPCGSGLKFKKCHGK